ncbi:pyroglutamyl-peptidase [Roseibium hamelinense]|uniref:Pyrrolidone-carboxylate peptidase n=1 Tax=Roseibium hamelinense TaxID=150831 RepID=A0A562TJR0_9HYPH|nr:hypothetical protein [Roseibium hamelinense]TWI93356.1 pyroglutamyl-peptidase [Roseibium hamelinense]
MSAQKTLLVTGFTPFPGMPVNPTALFIRRFPRIIGFNIRNVRLHYAVLPATWRGRQAVTQPLIDRLGPDAVIHFGADGKRSGINIETLAVNRANQVRCDAEGRLPGTAYLAQPAERARRATLAPKRLRDAAARTGAAVSLSTDAGDYLCNATLWDTLGRELPAVFVHVPRLNRGRYDRRPDYPLLERAARAVVCEAAQTLR